MVGKIMINDNNNGTKANAYEGSKDKADSKKEEIKTNDIIVSAFGFKQTWDGDIVKDYLIFKDGMLINQIIPSTVNVELFEAYKMKFDDKGIVSEMIPHSTGKTKEERKNMIFDLLNCKEITINKIKYDVIEGVIVKITGKTHNILKVQVGKEHLTVFSHELIEKMDIKNGYHIRALGVMKEISGVKNFNAEIIVGKPYIKSQEQPPKQESETNSKLVQPPKPLSNLEEEIQRELCYDNLTGLNFDNESIIKYNPKVFRLSKERGIELIEIGKPDSKGNVPDPVYISITNQPIFINRIFENKDDGRVYNELKFKRSRNSEFITTEQPIPNDILLSSKKVHKISGLGFNFTEDAAKHLCHFFIEIIDKNEDTMERVKMYSTMGWKNNFTSFVIGDKEYFQDRVEDVVFKGLNDKMVTAFQSKGTAEGWVNDTKALLKHNAIRYVCYASCAAPLMKILGQDNRINNIHGDNNTSKTIRLWLCMSIWAHPVNSMLTSDNTKNFFEGMAKSFNNLPVHFDETSIIKADEIDEIIYKLGNGGGRGRMTVDLVARDTGEWKTTFLMSGEKKITTDDTLGGAKVRAIDICSNKMPFDRVSVVEYKTKAETNCENYGVIAPILIRKIMSIGRDALNERYKACVKELYDEVDMKDNATAGRMVDSFAVFLLAGQLFEEIMKDIGGEIKKPEEIIFETVKNVILETADKPHYVRALVHLYSWVGQQEKQFKQSGQWSDEHAPNVCHGNLININQLEIFIISIKQAFKDTKYRYEDIKDAWIKEGIVFSDDNSKPKSRTATIGNIHNKTIIFNLLVIKSKYGLGMPFDISERNNLVNEDEIREATNNYTIPLKFKGEKESALNIPSQWKLTSPDELDTLDTSKQDNDLKLPSMGYPLEQNPSKNIVKQGQDISDVKPTLMNLD